MWQHSKNLSLFLFFLLLISNSIFAKKATYTAENPKYLDSILRTQVDTAKWMVLQQNINIHKTGATTLIQSIRKNQNNTNYILFGCFFLLLLLIIRLIFEDFMYAIVDGLYSVKKFYTYYKTKKYDSLMAILLIMVLKVLNISFIIYTIVQYIETGGFLDFNIYLLLKILLIIALFYAIKSIIELVFNEAIGMRESYNAFYLFTFFTEFITSILFLLLLIVFIYNNSINIQNVYLVLLCGTIIYVVFNIIRSYQLMDNFRIASKLQFFMYICTFKILPFLILVRYIFNNVIV